MTQTPGTVEARDVRNSRCLDVSRSFLGRISAGEFGGPTPLRFGQAVKAAGFDSVYFVSAYIEERPVGGDPGATHMRLVDG